MTCVYLRDKKRAALLFEILLPYADRVGVASVSPGLPVRAALAGLAEVLGRYQEAERQYRANLDWAEQVGYRPIRVRSLIDFARMHLERAGPGDGDAALALLNEALPLAREMGMAPFVERALALKMQLQGVDSRDASRSIFAVANSVQARRPSFAPLAASDGTVTLMFSDLEAFTEMTERLGDADMHELMQLHNAIVREQLDLHGGHEVELRGDGFLLAFDDGARAVRCAIGLQTAFAHYNEEHPDHMLRVRIGLHCGEAIRDEERFFGKTVIQAFRVADLAMGGEILVSADLEIALRADSHVRVGEPREAILKGFSGTHQLFPILWG
jgi:class 3 adenylate cyclase